MNIKYNIVAFLILLFLCQSCKKESEEHVIISIDNQTLFNECDYFVEVGIVLSESDSDVLKDLGRSDISKGGFVGFDPVKLNVGNYYLRYQYYIENTPSGGEAHKAFQIQSGEDTVVKIIR